MIPDTSTADTYELSDGTRSVVLEKLRTPNGERLVIESAGESVRLDAVALESLTWQDDEFFADLTGHPHEKSVDATGDAEPAMQIGNEYTTIRIRVHETGGGPVITLRSPKLEYQCRLSVAELAAVAGKSLGFFSDLLETPLGPESDHSHIL